MAVAKRPLQLDKLGAINSSDFVSYVDRAVAAMDPKSRPIPRVILKELNEIFNRIVATSSFSSVDLRERVRVKYVKR